MIIDAFLSVNYIGWQAVSMTHIPNLQVKFVMCHNYERVMLRVQSYCLQNFKFQAEPSAYVLRSTYFYGLLQVLIYVWLFYCNNS